ncbi:hypothetical protein [Tardiphaga sp.]|uniref:hypothetical protein n=1 Tax=Tardiphaga sp. TaxID=1926292 RepID=UPI0037D9ED5A
MPKVDFTTAFLRDLKRLKSSPRQDAVIEAVSLFVENPKAPKLNFERVLSRSGYFSIRASHADRVLLFQIDGQHFEIAAVGNHDYIYRGYFKNR